jgi:hypothetical protein
VSIWVVLSFIFFSGMDFLGSSRLVENPTNTICLLNSFNFQLSFFYKILSNVVAANQLEWWAVIFQYSSITTQLYFVFNQCIPAWIITLLIIDQKNSRNIFFYYSILIFYGPFPFIGLFPVVVYKFFEITKKEIQAALQSDQKKLVLLVITLKENRLG